MIKNFILETMKFPRGAKVLTYDYPLLEKGVVDSLGIHKIVAFIQDQFGVEINEEDLTPTHFMTIDAIASLVAETATGDRDD